MSVNASPSYSPRTVAHHVLNSGVDQDLQTCVNQRNQEERCILHSVAREQELLVDLRESSSETVSFVEHDGELTCMLHEANLTSAGAPRADRERVNR
jgi:hypothetical protein